MSPRWPWDVIAIGGGLAGAAAAGLLATAGRRVLVLERDAGPRHKLCGEFLSGDAGPVLARLGVDPLALGGVPLDRVRLVGQRTAAAAPLPFPAWGLSRLRLDAALLAAAEHAGAEIRRGAAATALEPSGTGWRVRLRDGGAVEAPVILLATGKHELRGHPRAAGSRPDSAMIGFKLHLTLAPAEAAALAGQVEIMPLAGGYAGLQPIGDGRATLCLVVTPARFQAAGATWPGLLAALRACSPALAARLDGAVTDWPRPLAIAGIPYGFLHRDPAPSPGLFRLGDQFAVIPSLTGAGMALALQGAALAADRILAGDTAAAFHAMAAAAVAGRLRRALWLDALLHAGPGRAAAIALGRAVPGLITLAARATHRQC